jgi:translation initiation factor IF-3
MRRRRLHRPKPKPQIVQKYRVNEGIFSLTVYLIDGTGKAHGEVTREAALAQAKLEELDLVEVSPQAKPPVCKILDYGKFLYHESKKEQVAKTKQKKVDIKGIRLGMHTDKHDLLFKKEQAEKFLGKGHKVKVELFLRGREKGMNDRARATVKAFIDNIAIPHKIEEEMKRGPKGLTVLIVAE